MLDIVFMQILDMTVQASIVILIVILARLLLKRAPKVFSYMLWAIVLFRLLCPVSIEAPVSVVPEFESVSDSYTLEDQPITVLDAGVAAYQAVGDAVNGGLGIQHVYTSEVDNDGNRQVVSAAWWEVWILFGQYVWLAGIAGLLIYSVVTYCRLRRKLIGATPLQGNIYLADHIDSPFVLGLVKPQIYLPSALGEKELVYIIAHELHHIRRLDHVVKLIAFIALALHWFNPLVWGAYILFCKDMEMSCDEAVIKKHGEDIRADYSASLLNLATGRKILAVTPLAFGEGDTKGRINNLSKWKKPMLWVIVASVLVCLAVAICLLTDPIGANDSTIRKIVNEKGYTVIEQCTQEITLSVPTSSLPDSIYSENGCEFPDGEIVAYKDDTVTIYLKSVQYSNEGTDNLYFCFDFLFDVAKDGGVTLYPLEIISRSPQNGYTKNGYANVVRVSDGTIRAGDRSFIDAVSDRGQGSFEKIWFYVSTDVLNQINGTMEFDIRINRITYLKDGADANAAYNMAGYQYQADNVPELTEVTSDTTESSYMLQVYLPKTDFSKLSQAVSDKVAAEWHTYDSLTDFARLASSHLFGVVYLEADTWEKCEADLGLTMNNPLDSVAWLTDTAYFGGNSTDLNVPHVKATVYATHASNRQVSVISVRSGYKSGDIRVSIDATVCAEAGIYTTGAAHTRYVTFQSETTTTGSGIPVLIMIPDGSAGYSDLTAYWINGNVFYSLSLVGDKDSVVEVRTELERILTEI